MTIQRRSHKKWSDCSPLPAQCRVPRTVLSVAAWNQLKPSTDVSERQKRYAPSPHVREVRERAFSFQTMVAAHFSEGDFWPGSRRLIFRVARDLLGPIFAKSTP